MATTWMCDNGQHGTSERRSLTTVDWSAMYEGHCAGTAFSMAGTEVDCERECHNTLHCPKQDGSRYAELRVAADSGEYLCDVCGMSKSWHA